MKTSPHQLHCQPKANKHTAPCESHLYLGSSASGGLASLCFLHPILDQFAQLLCLWIAFPYLGIDFSACDMQKDTSVALPTGLSSEWSLYAAFCITSGSLLCFTCQPHSPHALGSSQMSALWVHDPKPHFFGKGVEKNI